MRARRAVTRAEKAGPNIDVRSSPPRSVLGLDAGLASFGCAHVEQVESERDSAGLTARYRLVRGSVYAPPDVSDATSVAEENAWRAAHLLRWLQPVLRRGVAEGAEAFHAERYEQLRQASAAAKYSAGHAVLVAASAICDPRPRLQRDGYGGPAFVSGRAAKRAATGCDVATKAVAMAAARQLIGGMADALRGLNAEQRPHLADAGIVALHALGHRERPILLTRIADSGKESAIGSSAAFGGGFEVWTKHGERWAGDAAAERWFAGRAVVFVGFRVAKAFGVVASAEPLTWFAHAAREDAGKKGAQPSAYMAAVLPDLGGEWWGVAKNAAGARLFLRAAGRSP